MANTLSPRMKTLSRNLRKDMTQPEIKLWHELRSFKNIGAHFRKQVPMGRYIVDFACHRKKLIIELDGDSHGYEDQRLRDNERDAWLGSQGYRVMRIWNSELYDNLDGVLDEINRYVTNDCSETAIHPTPNPSPSRGGEQKSKPPSPSWRGIEGGGPLRKNAGGGPLRKNDDNAYLGNPVSRRESRG